jgi:Arc/MetJ family transcription regulator
MMCIWRCIVGRTNIVLDDPLIEEAMRLSGIGTKREVVHVALDEFVETRTKKNLFDLFGSNLIDDEYDYKSARKAVS